MATDPIALIQEHFARADASDEFDASRAALATVRSDGQPSVRFVLVRHIEAQGLSFYTNYESDKALELEGNPHASLAFHWWATGVQVRATGPVTRTSPSQSDAYFASRPRQSQLGAWASDQSRPLVSHEALVARFAEVEAQYRGEPVPRPAHWGGYTLAPVEIELWHNGDHRLHDRFRHVRDGGAWIETRLAP